MENLLQIETAFLAQSEVKTALNLTEIKKVTGAMSKADKKRFEDSLKLSKLVKGATEWYESEQGKAKLRDAGIKWNKVEFGEKAFGYKKAYFFRLLQVANIEQSVVDEFNAQCDELEAQRKEVERSINALVKFSKATNEVTEDGGNGGEDSGEGAQVEERTKWVFTLSCKASDTNVSVRVSDKNEVKTTNTRAEIEAAIAFLQSALNSTK